MINAKRREVEQACRHKVILLETNTNSVGTDLEAPVVWLLLGEGGGGAGRIKEEKKNRVRHFLMC